MKTINSYNLENKRVLLRADLNSDVKNKRVLMSERIKQSSEIINLLKKKKAKIIILAHQGRPEKNDFTSLKQHSNLLNKYTKVKFVNDIIGEKAKKEIKNLKSGEALLLENVRFLEEEFKPGKNNFVKTLSSLCDIYVNDAFSNSHRKHSSMVSFPKYMKSCAGPLLYKEVNALQKIKIKNAIYILAGAKPEDDIKLLNKGNKVLVGGIFALICLIAKGYDLGKHEKDIRKKYSNLDILLKKIKPQLKNVLTPLDFAICNKGTRKEILLEELPVNYLLLDIGSKTIDLYSNEIKKAKAIYMKGPVGMAEYKNFSKGTEEILKLVANAKGFSLIGGGHLSSAINRMKISKNSFDYLSLSGGALLRYIAGEKIPGVEVLR